MRLSSVRDRIQLATFRFSEGLPSPHESTKDRPSTPGDLASSSRSQVPAGTAPVRRTQPGNSDVPASYPPCTAAVFDASFERESAAPQPRGGKGSRELSAATRRQGQCRCKAASRMVSRPEMVSAPDRPAGPALVGRRTMGPANPAPARKGAATPDCVSAAALRISRAASA